MLLLLMLLFLFLIELHKIAVVVRWLILLLVLRFFSVCVGSYWHCSFFLICQCCLLLMLSWCCWSCSYSIRKKIKILLYFLFNAWYGCCFCWLPFLVFFVLFQSLFYYIFLWLMRLFRCFVVFCCTTVVLKFSCIYFML